MRLALTFRVAVALTMLLFVSAFLLPDTPLKGAFSPFYALWSLLFCADICLIIGVIFFWFFGDGTDVTQERSKTV